MSGFVAVPSLSTADVSGSAAAKAVHRSTYGECLCDVQVDIVVTVSGFSAIPSLSTAVASRFNMRSDVECFSLSGHGCAGGLVAIGLTEQLLLVSPTLRTLHPMHPSTSRVGCRDLSWPRRSGLVALSLTAQQHCTLLLT